MAKVIFSCCTSTRDESLWMEDDGSFVHHSENDGWAMARQGLLPSEHKMTAAEAKERWPQYAARIDEAADGN
jgi:hypothetical protein